ncbi:MAG TPA: hypothetical protein VK400_20075 [Pyrinomonadaceae bacterium]|nr:hypothetical protein [Pyrinomonadaceae bacterium]
MFEGKARKIKENPNFIAVGTRRSIDLKNNCAQFNPLARASQEKFSGGGFILI